MMGFKPILLAALLLPVDARGSEATASPRGPTVFASHRKQLLFDSLIVILAVFFKELEIRESKQFRASIHTLSSRLSSHQFFGQAGRAFVHLERSQRISLVFFNKFSIQP